VQAYDGAAFGGPNNMVWLELMSLKLKWKEGEVENLEKEE
jgi:hypothetical protein